MKAKTSDWEERFDKEWKYVLYNAGNGYQYSCGEELKSFISQEIKSARASGYEVGYEEGTDSGHADIVAFLDTDSVDWGEAIQEAISRARTSERAKIIEIIQKHKYQKDIKSKLKSQNPLKEILKNKSQQTRIQVVNDILDELLSKLKEDS
jgi:hypothetical protein